jgi:hypothetical protein
MQNINHPLAEQNMKKITRKVSRHSTLKTVPLNYEEFRIHPFNGAVVGRCLAKSRRTGLQCGAYAVSGFAVCFHHGGSRGSGKRSILGEKARYEAVYKHGDRSQEVTTRRSDASKELFLLRQAAYATGLLPWWGSAKKEPKLNSVQLALKVVKKYAVYKPLALDETDSGRIQHL